MHRQIILYPENKHRLRMPHTSTPAITHFITRWKASGASERANYQLFLTELCELLGVEKPMPATDKVHEATYTFERPVVFDDGEGKTSTNFIDLYKKDCFVLEAKQGADKASITEAEQLGAERAKTKTGTATRDTRTWEREMKRPRSRPCATPARCRPPKAGRPSWPWWMWDTASTCMPTLRGRAKPMCPSRTLSIIE